MREFRLRCIGGRCCSRRVPLLDTRGAFYGLLKPCIAMRPLLPANLLLWVVLLHARWRWRIGDRGNRRSVLIRSRLLIRMTIREGVCDSLRRVHQRRRDCCYALRLSGAIRGYRRLCDGCDRDLAFDHLTIARGGIGCDHLLMHSLSTLFLLLDPVLKAEDNR